MNKAKSHECLHAKERRNSLQTNVAQGSVTVLFTTKKMKMSTKSKTETEANEELPFTPLTAESALNINATSMFMLHPDFHAEFFKDKGTDTTDPVAMAQALADEANERLSDRALLLQHTPSTNKETGIKSVYVNATATPSRNQTDGNRSHYVKPVIGGLADDPEVKKGRAFANGGLPDTRKKLVKGQRWYWGNASMHTFQYKGSEKKVEVKRNTTKPRSKKS